ncbi:hypothetical protein CYLTODRAFT_460153 [Cylindrobasidium torrendii FP15055 ss-10]|uniref:Uncharacterized protein n=1 Tax=Cylindrobasidium torrendii FP15055 ss-10 TaxID=1314674 RepID=A0A0D7ATC5_9AGAR|nr:hypothetical protein CYLTODRAFT_460153 [Cylindrobasidium torrendii FP15055 ss-10]
MRHDKHGHIIPVQSKSKKDAHLLLAHTIFGDPNSNHCELYIRTIQTKDGAAAWALKIKNKISKLNTKFRKYHDMMGTTGDSKGITAEDQIDMSKTNSFTDAWNKICQEAPWYWDYKALIGACPNLIGEGIDHGADSFDVSILMPPTSKDTAPSPIDLSDHDSKSDDSTVTTKTAKGRKRAGLDAIDVKPTKLSKLAKATHPKAVKLTLAPKSPAFGGARNKADASWFSEIAQAEEETRRKYLEIKMICKKNALEYCLAKVKAATEKDKNCCEFEFQKWQYKMEMDMCCMGGGQGGSSSANQFVALDSGSMHGFGGIDGFDVGGLGGANFGSPSNMDAEAWMDPMTDEFERPLLPDNSL